MSVKYTVDELIEAMGEMTIEEIVVVTRELRKLLDEEPRPPAGAGVKLVPLGPTLGGSNARRIEDGRFN